MNSSYLNMTAGAFLGTCFVAMTLSIVSGAIYESPAPEKEGFVIKVEKQTASTGAPKKAEVPPIAPLLAKADAKEGQQVFKKCQACHSGEKGGANKIGPDLYGIVDRPIAEHEGFSYSSALKKFSDDGKKKWTYERLNHWLHDPRGYVSGTAMTFPGVKKDQERADVIAYLHTLADKPVPFPKPEPAKKSGDKTGTGQSDSDASGSGQSGAADSSADNASAGAGKTESSPDDKAPGQGEAAVKSGSGNAGGNQSSKPEAGSANKAPTGNDANAGSKNNTQNAQQENPSAQGTDDQGKPADKAEKPAQDSTTKKPATGDTAQ